MWVYKDLEDNHPFTFYTRKQKALVIIFTPQQREEGSNEELVWACVTSSTSSHFFFRAFCFDTTRPRIHEMAAIFHTTRTAKLVSPLTSREVAWQSYDTCRFAPFLWSRDMHAAAEMPLSLLPQNCVVPLSCCSIKCVESSRFCLCGMRRVPHIIMCTKLWFFFLQFLSDIVGNCIALSEWWYVVWMWSFSLWLWFSVVVLCFFSEANDCMIMNKCTKECVVNYCILKAPLNAPAYTPAQKRAPGYKLGRIRRQLGWCFVCQRLRWKKFPCASLAHFSFYRRSVW